MLENFERKSKDLGLTSKDIEKRKKAFDVNIGESESDRNVRCFVASEDSQFLSCEGIG